MKPFVRLALATALVGLAVIAWSTAGSAQARPEAVTRASQPSGWEVSFSPRVGFFLPQRGNSGSSSAVRRPTYGVELVAKRKGSWYGARALFERSMRWAPQRDLASSILSNGLTVLDDGGDSQFFETVVVDAMAFTPAYEGVRAYMFTGFGSKIIGSPDDVPILPYSLVGADRARTWHGGLGIEAPIGGGAAVFEVGDYYGRNGGDSNVHDFHVTLMARFSGVGDLIRTLITGEDSDG